MNINETLSNKNVFLNEKKTHRKPFLISNQTKPIQQTHKPHTQRSFCCEGLYYFEYTLYFAPHSRTQQQLAAEAGEAQRNYSTRNLF